MMFLMLYEMRGPVNTHEVVHLIGEVVELSEFMVGKGRQFVLPWTWVFLVFGRLTSLGHVEDVCVRCGIR